MKINNLDGTESAIQLKKKDIEKSRSKGQEKVKSLLERLFTSDKVFEEFLIPQTRLSLDFFIPSYKLAIEVQGKQHSQRVEFYQKFQKDFEAQKARDEEKALWCKINQVKLIEIFEPHKMNPKTIKDLLIKEIEDQ